MSTDPSTPAAPALAQGRFAGPAEFAQCIRQALAAAASQGWREIVCCDPDFADWPLGERAVAQALNDWSRGGRKFTLMADDYGAIARQHARFVTWRRTWSHIVECRKNAAHPADSLPSVLWSPGWVVERLDRARSTGVAGADAERRALVKNRLDEFLLRSTAAFPATVLGL